MSTKKENSFGKKSIPTNKKLYSKAISEVKAKVKVWPSAYASGQVVQRYKRLGGKYSSSNNLGNNLGNNFGNSNKFYRSGSQNSLFLTPDIKKCLTIIYGQNKVLTRFGKSNPTKRISSNNSEGLKRWFKEKWVNVCSYKNGKYQPCSKSTKKYPYCRPSIRVTSKTPKTISEITKTKLKKLCKRKTNSKKIFV
jgi:hypothetical protein